MEGGQEWIGMRKRSGGGRVEGSAGGREGGREGGRTGGRERGRERGRKASRKERKKRREDRGTCSVSPVGIIATVSGTENIAEDISVSSPLFLQPVSSSSCALPPRPSWVPLAVPPLSMASLPFFIFPPSTEQDTKGCCCCCGLNSSSIRSRSSTDCMRTGRATCEGQ